MSAWTEFKYVSKFDLTVICNSRWKCASDQDLHSSNMCLTSAGAKANTATVRNSVNNCLRKSAGDSFQFWMTQTGNYERDQVVIYGTESK